MSHRQWHGVTEKTRHCRVSKSD